MNTNNKTCLRYFCKHGGRVKDKKGTGERIKQHNNHMGCTALISFYKSQKNGSLTCTKVASEHNHAVSENIYNQANVQLDEEELTLCANLKSGNCQPSQIKRVLLNKYRKDITIQKLKNVTKGLAVEETDEIDLQTLKKREEMWTGWRMPMKQFAA